MLNDNTHDTVPTAVNFSDVLPTQFRAQYADVFNALTHLYTALGKVSGVNGWAKTAIFNHITGIVGVIATSAVAGGATSTKSQAA